MMNVTTIADSPAHLQLKLPSGVRIKDADRGHVYREFARLKVPGFQHSLGFSEAVAKYAAHLESIGAAAAEKAVADYLEANKVTQS